jgi:hypothetical protein
MNSFTKPADQPFAGDGGIPVEPRQEDDPYGKLDDLMAVVEALCPHWPQRSTFESAGQMLL